MDDRISAKKKNSGQQSGKNPVERMSDRMSSLPLLNFGRVAADGMEKTVHRDRKAQGQFRNDGVFPQGKPEIKENDTGCQFHCPGII